VFSFAHLADRLKEGVGNFKQFNGWETCVRTTDLEFTTADGFTLVGTLHLPDELPAPLVVGCHGLLSDRRSPKQVALAEACGRTGIAYFRFDHRGCGDSSGELEHDTSLDTRCRDLLGAIDHLAGRPEVAQPFGLFGSSMGGAVCLRTAAGRAVGPLVTFAAPARSGPLHDAAAAPGVPRDLKRMAAALGEPFDLAPDLPKIRRLLIFHGEEDRVVPVAHAREIHVAVGEPKRLVLQPEGDHLMSDPLHQQDFMRASLSWFARGLGRGAGQRTPVP
jgi:alpha-beta hydrolase superfamily lysophospholipase